MIAIIFEVWPHEDGRDAYLQLAATLRPRLEEIDGFISVERFQSITNPGKMLSLSLWRDEAAVERWRQVELHRAAQRDGREWIFKDYRLRVAGIIRDYGMFDRQQAPADSQTVHQA